MPKREIIHPPESRLSANLRDFLKQFFKEEELFRLEKLGGRIQISIASPYVSVKERERQKMEITDSFVEELRLLRNSPEEIRRRLGGLSNPQLKSISFLLGLRPKVKMGSRALRSLIEQYLTDQGIMERISGANERERYDRGEALGRGQA